MACYVDQLIDYTGRVPYQHKVWCHLVADSDVELLACAEALGVAPGFVQGRRGWDTHFDITPPLREHALALGARSVDFRFMARRTRALRAARSLGADLAAGGPVGATIEVPLPHSHWSRVELPPGARSTWVRHHPLLGDAPVVALSADGDVAGVATFTGPEALRVGLVLGQPPADA